MTFSEPFIADSARKHGVTDADSRHAYRNAILTEELDEGVVMVIGPDRSSRLLEVGVASIATGSMIVHAMPARPKYLR